MLVLVGCGGERETYGREEEDAVGADHGVELVRAKEVDLHAHGVDGAGEEEADA